MHQSAHHFVKLKFLGAVTEGCESHHEGRGGGGTNETYSV